MYFSGRTLQDNRVLMEIILDKSGPSAPFALINYKTDLATRHEVFEGFIAHVLQSGALPREPPINGR